MTHFHICRQGFPLESRPGLILKRLAVGNQLPVSKNQKDSEWLNTQSSHLGVRLENVLLNVLRDGMEIKNCQY